MPELPEVETVCLALSKILNNSKGIMLRFSEKILDGI